MSGSSDWSALEDLATILVFLSMSKVKNEHAGLVKICRRRAQRSIYE
jgi:hypothetical protein